MKKHFPHLLLQLTGAILFANVALADWDCPCDRDSTNRLALSLRLGFNISAKFKGIGGSLQPGAAAANGRRTREGDAWNYDDGYVLTDISGNFGNQTWYWGYENGSQISGNDILFHRTTAPGLPANRSDDNEPYYGAELTYYYQLGVKDNWHHMRYGVEGAANFMPVSLSMNNRFTGDLTRQTDAYPYTPGTTPPGAPYQGSFEGPGFVIGSVPDSSTLSTIVGATVLEKDSFDANLWGLRVGPYIEFPLNDRWNIHFSGGLAVGLLDSSSSWRQSIDIPSEGVAVFSGKRDRFSVLCGAYVSAEVQWQFSDRWNLQAGAQFQDIGVYRERLGLRKVELDLSSSLFVTAGLGYSF